MSVTFESPSHRTQNNDSYFTPLSMPSILSSSNNDATTGNNSGSTTPYFTAPVDPMIHQDFLNAIRTRHANQPGFSMNSPSTPPITEKSGFKLNSGGGGSSSTLANRRMLRCSNNNQSPRQQQQASPLEPRQLHSILANKGGIDKTLLLDTRSFVQYSHGRIRTAINISIPNTILKRPTFTMDRVYEAIVQESDRKRLERWQSMDKIIMYDHGSQNLPENCAASYMSTKLSQAGYKGQLLYLKGGFDTFSTIFPDECEAASDSSRGASGSLPQLLLQSQASKPQGAKPFSLKLPEAAAPAAANRSNTQMGPFTAPMPQFENHAFNPFFSNIRQNMELSHGPIRERFSIRLPRDCSQNTETGIVEAKRPRSVDNVTHVDENGHFIVPRWLRQTIVDESGPKSLAEMYEKLERVEQRRLQNIMLYHSKHTSTTSSEFPLSIVAGIERGTLNRYTNIWPFEYTRVKLASPRNDATDYINASYIQYTRDTADGVDDSHVSQASLRCMQAHSARGQQEFRRYISTQGPLPDTFADFWQMMVEQNSYVIVMLTKQEEMNKVKCHQYWPDKVNSPTRYGCVTVTLFSETVRPVRKDDQDDAVIIRQLLVQHQSNNTRRTVTQLQYTGWMDFGVPDTPEGTLQIVAAADEAQVLYETQQEHVGPMVVHCSAGCGRSGAFCAIDTVIHRLTRPNTGTPDKDLLFDTISRFREQRVSMVQTLRQFVFCYETIWWWLLGYGSTPAMPMDLSDN